MGNGIPSARMQRANHHSIQITNQASIQAQGTHSRSPGLHQVHRCGLTIVHVMENHIDWITKKANSTLGFLHRSLKAGSEETKANAYFYMVRSDLEYCCSVWSPRHKDQIKEVEMNQCRAARFTTNR